MSEQDSGVVEYPQVCAYLCVEDTDKAVAFYSDVLGATERMRFPMPDGKVGHCELQFGDPLKGGAVIMISDSFPEMDAYPPSHFGGSAVKFVVYVDDVDATVKRAVALGATLTKEVADQFHGDRSGEITDAWGHGWVISKRVERLSVADIQQRMEMMDA